MAAPTHASHDRSFGEKVAGAVEMAQRGVGAVMAAKGLYESAKNVYTLGRTVAPYLSSLAIL